MSRARYRARRRGLSVKRVGQHYFVLDQSANSIHHLNAIAHAVWRMFQSPNSKDAALITLAAAFPAEAKPKLRADLDSLVAELLDLELIQRVPR